MGVTEGNEYREKVYAGVLGKMIGVFYGRPVEGWPYEKIRDTFGMIERYIYREAGTPLIVADDDLAGTFTFMNAVEDSKDIGRLTAEDFGEAWLDYVIENKTIFWWGGLGRSTEHTAYLRLKSGIKSPLSGAAETNGAAVAEQIGAQIFMDALAMMCPDDPEMARRLVKMSASVSHDGIAVESACLLAGMEAMAFSERSVERLLQESERLGMSERMKRIINDVEENCARLKDYRKVRSWLEHAYGYHLYPGNCHVVPNLALILACLLLGGDSFAKAMNYCVSAGWDTDCNGANLGCLNAIRLGLLEITGEYDYRTPIAERFYNISAEGGNCVSDAERETYRIVKARNKIYGAGELDEGGGYAAVPRFSFTLPGSVQGFSGCPYLDNEAVPAVNGNRIGYGNGILLEAGKGRKAVSTPTMWDKRDRQANYCLTGSPVLYEGQTVKAAVKCVAGAPAVRLYLVYLDFNDKPVILYDEWRDFGLSGEAGQDKMIYWDIPSLQGRTIVRLGLEMDTRALDGAKVLLKSMDWPGAPRRFEIKGSLRNYDMQGFNMMMEAFVSSAKQFSFDSRVSFTISHAEENGVVTTGTSDWDNYAVSSVLAPGLHQRCGIVGRCRGHRRYYGAFLWENRYLGIIKKQSGKEYCLARMEFTYQNEERLPVMLYMKGSRLEVYIMGKKVLTAQDDEYRRGGAGFMVDCGTMLADGFCVEAV